MPLPQVAIRRLVTQMIKEEEEKSGHKAKLDPLIIGYLNTLGCEWIRMIAAKATEMGEKTSTKIVRVTPPHVHEAMRLLELSDYLPKTQEKLETEDEKEE